MNIRILGFEWKPTQNVTLAKLRQVLDAETAVRTQKLASLLSTGAASDWDGRLFALADKGDFWVGVVLKVRDQKLFCQVTSKSGKLVLAAQDLAEGSKMVEVNFFILHKTTGKGLYQFYHHSTWLDSFSNLCKRILDQDVGSQRTAIEEQGREAGWTRKEINLRKQAITGTLIHTVLVRREEFDKLVDSLSRIKQVKISFRDDSINVPQMGVLTEAARSASIQLSFEKGRKASDLKAGIKQVANALTPSRMRVVGQTTSGVEEVVNLANNYDAFDEFDFDDAAADLDLDLSNPGASLEASGMIARLLAVAQKPRVKKILETQSPPEE